MVYELKGRTALVTGAASGIGRAVAVSLAGRGCHLALCDVNDAGLRETARLLGPQAKVSRHLLDVGDRDAIGAFPDEIARSHPQIDLLFNVAGVALGGAFEDTSEADAEWLFDINFWGVVRMTRAFLPMLRRSTEARIVNVSSIYGLVAPPGQAAYSASKFAVRGFSQALAHELQGTNIGVTTVHPGGIATGIADNARVAGGLSPEEVARGRKAMARLLRMPPAQAGEIIVKAVEARRTRVLVGSDAKFVALLERLAPVSYWRVLAAVTKSRR